MLSQIKHKCYEKKNSNLATMDKRKPTKYIKQPYRMSTLRGEMKLNQVRLLVEFMDILGNKVDDLLNGKIQTLDLFSDFESNEDGDYLIDIPLNQLTEHCYLYKEIESLVKDIAAFQITTDDESEFSVTNVFTKVAISKIGSRRNSVRIQMSKSQARTLFNFSRYSIYIKDVAYNAKSVHTSRLYMLLSTEKFRGEWTVSYQRLRDIFGFNEYGKGKNGEIVLTTKENIKSVKYKEYKDFKKRILKIAEEELKTLAEEGKSDFYFTYEEIYAPGVKKTQRNDPNKIKFYIYKSERGKLEDSKRAEIIENIEYEKLLKDLFNIKSSECAQVIKLCKGIDKESFRKKIFALKKTIDKKKDIENKSAYIMQSIRSILIELTPDADEMKDKTELTPEEGTSGTVAELSASNKEKFAVVLDSVDKMWREAIHLKAVEKDSVVIVMPAKATYDAFCGQGGKSFFSKVEDTFGKKVITKFENK